jgi:hypothetical protein
VSLYDNIMNISCKIPDGIDAGSALAYRYGHRDARHAAAELADATDAKIAALRELLGRVSDGIPGDLPIQEEICKLLTDDR